MSIYHVTLIQTVYWDFSKLKLKVDMIIIPAVIIFTQRNVAFQYNDFAVIEKYGFIVIVKCESEALSLPLLLWLKDFYICNIVAVNIFVFVKMFHQNNIQGQES